MNQERLIGTEKRLDKILKVVQIVNIVVASHIFRYGAELQQLSDETL